MRRLAFFAVLVLGTFSLMMSSSIRAAAGRVEYTWTLSALGPGGWIGGPLFEDGSVGGGGALSINNGRILARFEPTIWTENASEEITVCFDVSIHKGPSNALPPTICTPPMEPTGTPVKIMIFGSEHIFRITENH